MHAKAGQGTERKGREGWLGEERKSEPSPVEGHLINSQNQFSPFSF